MELGRALVELRGAGVTRGGAPLLHPLDFRLMPGGRWAVLGANGAGKTTFLRLVRGETAPDAGGLRLYDLPGAGGPQPTPLGLRHRLAHVSGDMQDAFAAHDWAATGLDVVLSGFTDAPLLYAGPRPGQVAAALALLEALGLSALSGRRLARLSSGEGRRLLLARALVAGPDVLILDECLEGLDASSRADFLAVLDRAAEADPGLAMLFATHRLDELPGCLDRALVLQAGRARFAGGIAAACALLEPGAAPTAAEAGVCAPQPDHKGAGFLARIAKASVDVAGVRLLADIHWTIRPGEHWAVLGANGAGKSTLLSLLAGEFWPSAVDGPPGTVEYGFAAAGETVDEARRRIGLVSASLQALFPYDLRVEEAVRTGLARALDVFAEPDAADRARVSRWLEFLGLAALAGRRWRSLSRGQRRRVLLARALAGEPSLLVLDEPMAGLDPGGRAEARALFDRLAGEGVPLVVAAHHEADLPERINRVLRLRSGRVEYCGEREAYVEWEAARRAGRASRND